MLKNTNIIVNEEKFLCYCSKVTNKTFAESLNASNFSNLENICTQLNLAKKCSACLPAIEDKYYQLKGRKQTVRNIISKNIQYSLKDKIKFFLDSLFGNTFNNLHGYLPMLASKYVKTWLVLSNDNPSIIEGNTVPFNLKCVIYNEKGRVVKKINKTIFPTENIKVCLNNFICSKSTELKTYYVKVTRSAIEKGFRGSTRTHFFYEAKKSMATLHTQYGTQNINSIKYITSKNEGKNFVFMINPSRKKARIKSCIKSYSKNKRTIVKNNNITLSARGSKLYNLNQINTNYTEHLFNCKSIIPIKCYFIITDKSLENFSVDHI